MFIMVSNHFPTLYGWESGGQNLGWITLMILIAIGWFVTKLLYGKAATPAPAQF